MTSCSVLAGKENKLLTYLIKEATIGIANTLLSTPELPKNNAIVNIDYKH